MNNLEFRAWDITDKEMIHNPSLFFDGTEYYVVVSSGFGDEWYRIGYEGCGHEYRFELMQWTGLKDKNGMKIFEGDILEHCDDHVVVEKIIPIHRFYMSDQPDDWMSFSDVDYEVIGNVYENPELINDMGNV